MTEPRECARQGCEVVFTPHGPDHAFCCTNCVRRESERRLGRAHQAHLAGRPHRCSCGNYTASDTVCGQCARRAAHRAAVAILVAMWREGFDRAQIAAAVGWAPKSVTAQIALLRRQGVDLPHRRPDIVGSASLARPGEQVGQRAA